MKSLNLMTWLLTLGVFAGVSSFGPSTGFDPQSLNDAQYKDYLINLKCPEIRKFYGGFVKVQEVGGPVYDPSLSPLSLQQEMPPLQFSPPPMLPNLPSPTTLPSPAEVPTFASTTLMPRNSSQSDSDPYSEYDEDITRSKREDNDAGQTTSVPIFADVTLPGYVDNATTNDTEECTAPLTKEWTNYNWYQVKGVPVNREPHREELPRTEHLTTQSRMIGARLTALSRCRLKVLLDNGGPPADYLRKGLKTNLTKVSDPCERPVYPVQHLEERTTFGLTHTKFEKVYRSEQAEIMLAGTPHEFVDVKGDLVWAPLNSTRRYFHLTYHKDDTGLYFQINFRQKCVFYESRVDCQWMNSICDCENGKEHCEDIPLIPVPVAGLPPGLQAALVGSG